MNGELGNHIEISSDNIFTVYAHCKTIYVKEGEEIIQGQKLGEVGMTRKCNWTTFTFRNKKRWEICRSRPDFRFLGGK